MHEFFLLKKRKKEKEKMESLTLRMDGVGSLGRLGVEGVGGLRRSWVAGV
jgi:hypothetical protein